MGRGTPPTAAVLQDHDQKLAAEIFVQDGRNAREFLRFLSDVFGGDFGAGGDQIDSLTERVRSIMQRKQVSAGYERIISSSSSSRSSTRPDHVLEKVEDPPRGDFEEDSVLRDQIDSWLENIEYDRWRATMGEKVWQPYIEKVVRPQLHCAREAGRAEFDVLTARRLADRDLKGIRLVTRNFIEVFRSFAGQAGTGVEHLLTSGG